MNVTLKITQDTLSPALKKIADSMVLVEKRRLLRALGEKFLQMTKENFGATGKWRSQGWKPLTKNYQKRIRYYGPPKLVLRGTLKSSIRLAVDSNRALVFTDSEYAAVHQWGGGNNIPPRPYFPVYGSGDNVRLTKRAEFELQNVLQSELNRMIR